MGEWSISSPTGGNTASVDNNGTVNVTANTDNKTHTYIVKYTENGHCGTYEFTQQGSSPGPQPTEKTVKLKLHNTDATRNMHIVKVLLYLTQVEDAVIIGEGGVDHESIIIENLNLCIEPNNSTDIDIPYTVTPTYKYFQNKGKNCGYSNVDKTIKIYGKSGWSECFAAPCLSGEINFSNRYDVYLTIDNYEDPSCSCS